MSFTATLDFGDLGEQDVEVEFDYLPGCRGSRDEPPSDAEVTITSVKWNGVEVIEDLDRSSIEALEEGAFDCIDDERSRAAEDRAEARYFDREAA